MANKTVISPSSRNHREQYGRRLWFAPDSRIRSKSALQQAIRVAEWVEFCTNPPPLPTEEQLFVTLHTCAYRASRKGVSPAEQAEWAGRWKTVREYIVRRNLGLVYSMLGKFSTPQADEDDLLSEAMLAITRAVDRFNPWRGYRFSTYACNAIARALMRRGKRESNYHRLFPAQYDALFEQADDGTYDMNSDLYLERLRRALDENAGNLSKIECHIIAKRFPDTQAARLTFQEIGITVGLSKERVRQIQNTALGKLREALTVDPVLR